MTRICSSSEGSVSMLEISRKGKQLKRASCGTFGGRSLVNGIEPESESMLSTVDLELSSFINPELTWKKVKKGSRTTTRRSRKSINQNLDVGAKLSNKSCRRDQDSSVSESEKHGVAVLGRRFAEKTVDVPIKKRRFSIRSPSPPPRTPPDDLDSLSPELQTPSPNLIKSERLVDIKPSGAGRPSNCKLWVFDKLSAGLKFEHKKVDGACIGNTFETINAGHATDDDFSGIELLAAAACSSSIDNEVTLKETCSVKAFTKEEAVYSPNATIPFKESIASSGTGHISDKDLVNEDDMGESAVNGTTLAAASNNENVVVAKNRAHWDLNTVMEAWEEPDDVTPVKSQISGGYDAVQSNPNDVWCDTGRAEQSVMCKEIHSDDDGDKELADDIGAIRSCIQHDTSKIFSSPEGTNIEKPPTEQVQEAPNVAAYDTIASIPVTNIEACGNHLCAGSQLSGSLHVWKDKVHANNCELEQAEEESNGILVEENRKSLLEGPQVEKLENSTPDLPPFISFGHEINDSRIKDSNDFVNTHESLLCKTSPRQGISTLTNKTSDMINSVGDTIRASHFHPSPNGEALSASSTSVVVGEVKLLADKASAADNNVDDVPQHNRPMGLFNNSNGSPSKVDQDNNISDCYDSNATKDCKKVNMDHISEYEAGYDSSFEDGELREPGVYTWEDNDLEGDTEYVDYGSEYGDGDDFDTVNSKSGNAENGQVFYQSSTKGVSVGNNDNIKKINDIGNRSAVPGDSVKSLKQCFNGDAQEGSPSACMKTNIFGKDKFNEHFEYRVGDEKVGNYDDKGLYGSRAFRGKLPSFSKGHSPFDAVDRRTLGIHQKRFDNNYSYTRAESDFSLEKSMGRGRFPIKPFGSRNETGGRWVDSPSNYRDTRNRYPQSYRGAESHAYSRPRDSPAKSVTKIAGFNSEDRRSINYSSHNGSYRSFMGRRSPVDREDSYFGQRGLPPARGIHQDRSRSTSTRYVQGIRRGPKDEYTEELPDDTSLHSMRRQSYFPRRQQGFSPNYGGGQFLRSRINSRSRSRTRSPVAWHPQRERNINTRRRSPDFRSDARMERVRSPFQKTSFGINNEESYMSPPRGRVSPRHNSRWVTEGNYMDNHLRDRSPVRMFRRSQRLDHIGYSGRKSDGIFQPNIRRGRYQQVSSSTRGSDFEGSDDDKRKHDDRYEINHRVRRYDAGGAVRRFRYDADDCFDARNAHKDDSFGRAIKRDNPRNGAEENRVPKYDNDRMYASASSVKVRELNGGAPVSEE